MMAKVKLRILEKISNTWKINRAGILESPAKVGTGRIFKFCYHTRSGEFLCATVPMHHNIMVLVFGSCKFAEYMRGIYFWMIQDEKDGTFWHAPSFVV